MKKLLFLLLFPLSAFAQDYTVIVPYPAGTIVDVLCRRVFEVYDSTFKMNTIVQNAPGADQIIAHNKLLTTKGSGILCAGNGVGGINQIINPASPSVDTIRPIINVHTHSHFIFSSSKINSIEQLINDRKISKKSILVGAPSRHQGKLFGLILEDEKVPYELVIYKKPADSIPSLKEGTLDVYVDGGSLKPSVQNMKEIRELAHIALKDKTDTFNYMKKYPHMRYLVSSVTLFVESSVDTNTVVELNRRLRLVMSSNDVVKFYKEAAPYIDIVNSTVKEAEDALVKSQKVAKDVFN